MTNFTPQEMLNNGFYPIDQKEVTVLITAAAIPAPAAGNCAAIIIKQIEDPAKSVYIGAAGVDTAKGFPLFNFNDATARQTPNKIIYTSDPTAFYLIASAQTDVRILYLGIIPQ